MNCPDCVQNYTGEVPGSTIIEEPMEFKGTNGCGCELHPIEIWQCGNCKDIKIITLNR
jgi:hypothetical protein